jgi:O-antigen/teichoic acid export membrane protein
MFGFIAISTTYVFGTLLTANGNLKHLNIMAAFGMIINIVLNIILIPRLQAMGAVYASLVTQFATAITQVIFAKKILGFKTNYRFLIKIATYVTAVSLTAYLSTFSTFDWKTNILIVVVMSLILIFTLRVLHFRYLYGILKSQ